MSIKENIDSLLNESEEVNEAVYSIKHKCGDIEHTTTSKKDAVKTYNNLKNITTDPTVWSIHKNGVKVHDHHNPHKDFVNEELNLEDYTKEETKLDMQEDINALLDGETLTEEFKEKTATIFEAAVLNRVKLEVTRLEEKFNNDVDARVEELKEGLVDNIDGFLSYMTEQWLKDNEVALEVGIKNQITENFITGLKTLFSESYIDVPAEKFDVLSDLQKQLDAVNEQLTETVKANIELTNELNEGVRTDVIAKIAEGLTDVDSDKFVSLAEEIKFTDKETYEKKLSVIKESYFKVSPAKLVIAENIVNDQPLIDEETKPTAKAVDPFVSMIAESMKTTKTKGSK